MRHSYTSSLLYPESPPMAHLRALLIVIPVNTPSLEGPDARHVAMQCAESGCKQGQRGQSSHRNSGIFAFPPVMNIKIAKAPAGGLPHCHRGADWSSCYHLPRPLTLYRHQHFSWQPWTHPSRPCPGGHAWTWDHL